MPKFEFCLPSTGKVVPDGPEWLHEIKFDGYRLRVERDGNRVRLITRGGYDWTKRFPWIAETALKNRRKQFVIDGEAVILGVDGASDFNALHAGKNNAEVQFCAFDVLAMDGEDLRSLPLSKRKTNLERLLSGPPGWHLRQPVRERCDWAWSLPRRLRHGLGGSGLKARRSTVSGRAVATLDQGEEPLTSRV